MYNTVDQWFPTFFELWNTFEPKKPLAEHFEIKKTFAEHKHDRLLKLFKILLSVDVNWLKFVLFYKTNLGINLYILRQ
jgi:hypothetical protein